MESGLVMLPPLSMEADLCLFGRPLDLVTAGSWAVMKPSTLMLFSLSF